MSSTYGPIASAISAIVLASVGRPDRVHFDDPQIFHHIFLITL